ncbi:hypothetical protein AMR41_30715 [Hapalosiphon sp. MRB220]|nr:hypothetical protein AMR41_30715 [Hapalosiphon sp. MRB220]
MNKHFLNDIEHVKLQANDLLHVSMDISNDSNMTFKKRLSEGRHGERHVYWRLVKEFGVIADLYPNVLRERNQNHVCTADIRVRRYDGQWFSLEVKTATKLYHTDDPSTYPESIIIDGVHAYNNKVQTCEALGEPLKATVIVSSELGVLVVPHKTIESWNVHTIKSAWGSGYKSVYRANYTHFRTLKELASYLNSEW